jgi:hypothetical protein
MAEAGCRAQLSGGARIAVTATGALDLRSLERGRQVAGRLHSELPANQSAVGLVAAGPITAAGTVIGTVVGTFFGVHVGAAGAAASAQRSEAVRQESETARRQAEGVKDTVVGGLSTIAAAAQPGSPPAVAVQQLIDSIKP